MNHPYKKYEGTHLWTIIKDCLNDLKENQDIIVNTREEYIIGYLCKHLDENSGTFNVD